MEITQAAYDYVKVLKKTHTKNHQNLSLRNHQKY